MAKTEWYERSNEITDHLVYTDKKAKELENLLNGTKTMIIRGAAGKKCPYGRVLEGDTLYFVENDGSFEVKARGKVISVYNSYKMTEEESNKLINDNIDKLNLAPHQLKRWAGKKFLCLIEVDHLEKIEPFIYNRTNNMDDWIIVSDINKIKKI